MVGFCSVVRLLVGFLCFVGSYGVFSFFGVCCFLFRLGPFCLASLGLVQVFCVFARFFFWLSFSFFVPLWGFLCLRVLLGVGWAGSFLRVVLLFEVSRCCGSLLLLV